MTKYHIKKDGTPGVCHAKNGNCPLGGSENHYDSMEDANAAAQEKMENEFGVLSNNSESLSSLQEKKTRLENWRNSINERQNSLTEEINEFKNNSDKNIKASMLSMFIAPGVGSGMAGVQKGKADELSRRRKELNDETREYNKELKTYNENVKNMKQTKPTPTKSNSSTNESKNSDVEIPVNLNLNKRQKNSYISKANKISDSKKELKESKELLNSAVNSFEANTDPQKATELKDEVRIAKGRVTKKEKQLKRNEDELNNFIDNL